VPLHHLHPPFNNQKVPPGRACRHGAEPFLRAQVGIKEYYRTCPSMFTCGTPYGSAKGQRYPVEVEPAPRPQALVKSSAMTARRCVDESHRSRGHPEAARRRGAAAAPAGFKVDLQAMTGTRW